MKTLAHCLAHALCALAATLAVPTFAAPVFLNPLVTITGVEAFAVNSYVQPGVSRNTNGSGPISDAVSELFGLSTADASASVTAAGLRAAASVHNVSTDGFTAFARSQAAIVNPFFIVPKAGFVGNQATIQIGYHLDGALNDSPGCPTCLELVQASLGVDGMSDQFYFLGVHSQGTINNPNGNVTGVNMGGTLVGLVPVNTELYFRGGLLLQVHCQAPPTCDASALFGSTLGYFGFSSDAVDFVWGLTPAAPTPPTNGVPEPSAWLLVGLGLVAMGGCARRRRRRATAAGL